MQLMKDPVKNVNAGTRKVFSKQWGDSDPFFEGKRYLPSYFIIDILAVLPLPQHGMELPSICFYTCLLVMWEASYCRILKLAVLAGDFLLSRAYVALASLKNTEPPPSFLAIMEEYIREAPQTGSLSHKRLLIDFEVMENVENIKKSIAADTVQHGARKIAVFETAPLGCIPQILHRYPKEGKICVEWINNDVELFNARLISLTDQLNTNLPDAQFIFINYTAISYTDIID